MRADSAAIAIAAEPAMPPCDFRWLIADITPLILLLISY